MKTLTCIPKLPNPKTHQIEFARQLHRALSTIGAAYIPVDSGLDDQKLLHQLKAFFGLSESAKRSFAQQLTAPWQGVFLPLGEEHLAAGQEDCKEVLDLNLAQGTYARWANQRRAQCRNRYGAIQAITSTALKQIVQPLSQVFDQFQVQANHVLAAIELMYHQPSGSLVNRHGKNSTLRLLHYPAAPHLTPGSVRLGAHQDYSGITLLWQDAVGGLEILTPQQEWVAVEIPPGCIGVIVGEVMQRWSGNTLHGAPHRVRINHLQQLQQSRYSSAFFCETNADCIVYPGSLLHSAEKFASATRSHQPIWIEKFLTNKYDQIMEKANL